MRKVSRLAAIEATVILVAGLLGCTCVCGQNCKENQKAGIPSILCQPMDQYPTGDKYAVFNVKAKGENLSYQWFVRNTNGISLIEGATAPQLKILGSSANAGFYFCVIDSLGKSGQVETQTRSALLTPSVPDGLSSSNMLAATTSTNGVSTLTITTYPPGGTGTNLCCTFCGWASFQNGGSGWPLTAGQTFTFYITDSSGLNVIPTSQYCAIWRYGGQPGQYGCCTPISSQQMRFTAPVSATYFITVYFKNSPCSPTGTQFYGFWGY